MWPFCSNNLLHFSDPPRMDCIIPESTGGSNIKKCNKWYESLQGNWWLHFFKPSRWVPLNICGSMSLCVGFHEGVLASTRGRQTPWSSESSPLGPCVAHELVFPYLVQQTHSLVEPPCWLQIQEMRHKNVQLPDPLTWIIVAKRIFKGI